MTLAKRRNPVEIQPHSSSLNQTSGAVGVPRANPPTVTAAPRVPNVSSNTRAPSRGVRHTSTAPIHQPAFSRRKPQHELENEREILTTQIAKNLILARHALGVTQEALAHESGVSRATIAQIESGTSDPRITTLADIARALGISPALLLLRPADLATLFKFVRKSEVDHVLQSLAPGRVDNMNRLRQSGLQKDLLAAALAGAEAARSAGYRSPGAIVGAGIGSAIDPGLGTAVGTLLGVVLDNGDNQSGELLEHGGGI